MLRVAISRGARCAEQGFARSSGAQWQPQRIRQPLRRTLADARTPDKVVLPGSQSGSVAGVPQTPILQSHSTDPASPSSAETPSVIPRTPPTPQEVSSTIPKTAPTPSTNPGNLPPTGTGTAATGPAAVPPPPPPRPRHRFRNFLLSTLILATLGYAGGVYYSLVNDNFHDFFTEYVPYGEDAVAYFEEREYRKRFPTKEYNAKAWPQARGESKVTIGRQSGLSAKVADVSKESDLGHTGRHMSAVADNKPQPGKAQQSPDATTQKEKSLAVDTAKKDAPPATSTPPTPGPAPKKDGLLPKADLPKQTLPTVEAIESPHSSEPVVQDLVKMVNNIITAVNASPEAAQLSSTVQGMKGELANIISSIASLKDQTAQEGEAKIRSAHSEFDNAAKELVRRLEGEMREQESKWREEYETERERLSQTYEARLKAELQAANQVAEEKNKTSLLQQEINMQKQHMETVQSKIEEERSGRLSKLDALSTSVAELENLTGEWNSVIDATLRTQHLQVALEAVRAKVLHASDTPSPFLNELVALKEISAEDPVVNAAIASINPVSYQRGIPSPASLIDRFRRVATEVRKASLLPADAGVASHAASAVLSRLMFAKKSDRGLPEGDDVAATLARTEVLLEEGDLDAAAREMNALQGWAGVLSRDWVGECRRVLEVRQAVDIIATEARLQSLLVD